MLLWWARPCKKKGQCIWFILVWLVNIYRRERRRDRLDFFLDFLDFFREGLRLFLLVGASAAWLRRLRRRRAPPTLREGGMIKCYTYRSKTNNKNN